MTVTNWLRKNASTILTCLGAAGLAATVVLAVKATPEAMDRLQQAKKSKKEAAEKGGREPEELTVPETVLACGPCYLPALAAGGGTLMCIFGANVLSRRQQASLASAYAALESVYRRYRKKVRDIFGPGMEQLLEKAAVREQETPEGEEPPWDETRTFYLPCCGEQEFFERTIGEVKDAEYHINRNLALRGDVTLNEFRSFLNLPPIEKGDGVGWDLYDGEAFYGYQWIDFVHRDYILDDGMLVCAIDTPFEPHPFRLSEYEGEETVPTCGVE